MLRVLVGLSVSVVAAMAAVAGDVVEETEVYREDFNAPRPDANMFGGVLLLGSVEGWRGSTQGDRYTLSNASDADSIRYLYFSNVPGADENALGDAHISVVVDGAFNHEVASAGVLYRLNQDAGTYYAFSVGGGGNYTVYERSPAGLRAVASGTHSAIVSGGANRLDVYSQAGQAAFYVNDERVISLSAQASGGGGVGLFAAGLGDFAFDDFSIFIGGAQPAPAPSSGK